jgi:hypothetical protein
MDNLIEDINVDDIYVSDANGLVNTRYILTAEPNNIMFTNASKATYFDRGIWGYIPSFIEIEVLKNDIDIINNYLISMGYNTIDLSNCWTSETYDADNAWTSDGEVIAKNVTCNYYIFGKRINY